jgi:hypothetical protein
MLIWLVPRLTGPLSNIFTGHAVLRDPKRDAEVLGLPKILKKTSSVIWTRFILTRRSSTVS